LNQPEFWVSEYPPLEVAEEMGIEVSYNIICDINYEVWFSFSSAETAETISNFLNGDWDQVAKIVTILLKERLGNKLTEVLK